MAYKEAEDEEVSTGHSTDCQQRRKKKKNFSRKNSVKVPKKKPK